MPVFLCYVNWFIVSSTESASTQNTSEVTCYSRHMNSTTLIRGGKSGFSLSITQVFYVMYSTKGVAPGVHTKG